MPGSFSFGPFHFEAEHRLLYRNGERLPLPPKAADLLLILLERRGAVMGKDQLLRLIWPDTFVEEGNLSKHIFFLRKTLENHDGTEYIETIPKRGYRFIGPVEHSDGSADSPDPLDPGAREEAVAEETDVPPRVRHLRRSRVLIAGSLAVAAAVATGAMFRLPMATRRDVVARSVLVLPFANLSGNMEEEYFSDGLTEELIENLTGVPGLRVIPRSTAFQFKGKAADFREVATRFHVDTLIEGAVRRDPDRLRITLRLLHANDGRAFWSRTFDRPLDTTIPTQEEIARAVMNAISVTETADAASPGPATSNLEAYNKVLRARFLAEQFWGDALDRALQLYKEAAALDPNYAEALAGQAFCYSVQAQLFLKKPVEKAYRAAEATARQAIAVNPRSVRGHNVLGQVALVYHHDWTTARKEFDAALSILPDDPWTLHASSHYWMAVGRIQLADRDGRRALAVDPLNGPHNAHQVWMHMMAEHYPDALARAERVFLDFGRDHRYTLLYVRSIYERTHHLRDALEISRRLGEPPDLLVEAAKALDGGDTAAYFRIFAHGAETGRIGWPMMAVELYAILGDREAMYRALRNAIDGYDPNVIQLNADPVFAPYRSEPRFQELMRSIRIPNI